MHGLQGLVRKQQDCGHARVIGVVNVNLNLFVMSIRKLNDNNNHIHLKFAC